MSSNADEQRKVLSSVSTNLKRILSSHSQGRKSLPASRVLPLASGKQFRRQLTTGTVTSSHSSSGSVPTLNAESPRTPDHGSVRGSPMRGRTSLDHANSPDVREDVSRVLARASISSPITGEVTISALQEALAQTESDLRQAAEVGATMVNQNAELVRLVEELQTRIDVLEGVGEDEVGRESDASMPRESVGDIVTIIRRDLEAALDQVAIEQRRRQAAVDKMDDLARVNTELQEALQQQSEAVEAGHATLIERIRVAELTIKEQQQQIKTSKQLQEEVRGLKGKLQVQTDLLHAAESRADSLEAQLHDVSVTRASVDDEDPAESADASDPTAGPKRHRLRTMSVAPPSESEAKLHQENASLRAELSMASKDLREVRAYYDDLKSRHVALQEQVQRGVTSPSATPTPRGGNGSTVAMSLADELAGVSDSVEEPVIIKRDVHVETLSVQTDLDLPHLTSLLEQATEARSALEAERAARAASPLSQASSMSGMGAGEHKAGETAAEHALHRQIETLQAQVKEARAKDGYMGTQLAKSESQLHTLQSAHSKLQSSHSTCTDTIAQLKRHTEAAVKRAREAEQKLTQSNVGELRSELQSANERIESMKLVLASAMPKYDAERERSASEMQKFKDSLRQEMDGLRSRVGALLKENAALKESESKAVALAKEHQASLHNLRDRIAQAERDAADKVQHMRDVLAAALEKQGQTQEQVSSYSETIAILESRLKERDSATDAQHRQTVEALRSEVSKVTVERDELGTQLSEARQACDAAETLAKRHAERIQGLEGQLQEEEAKLATARDQLAQVQASSQAHVQVAEKSHSELQALKQEMTQLQSQLAARNQAGESAVQDLTSELAQVRHDIENRNVQLATLKDEKKALNTQVNDLQQQRKQADKQFTEQSKAFKSKVEDLTLHISQLEQMVAQSSSQVNDLEDKLMDKDEMIASLEKQEQATLSKLRALEAAAASVDSSKSDKSLPPDVANQVRGELTTRVNSLQAELTTAEEINTTLGSELAQAKRELQQARDNQDAITEERDTLKKAVLEAKNRKNTASPGTSRSGKKDKELQELQDQVKHLLAREKELLASKRWMSTTLMVVLSVVILLFSFAFVLDGRWGPIPT